MSAKLTQEKLARDIDVAVSTIRRWEKGEAEPTMTVVQMKRFCKAVNKNFDELPDSLMSRQEVLSAVETLSTRGKTITNSRLTTPVQVRETDVA